METDVSVTLLPIFKEKICDCIGIVCKMSQADRVQAVQFWNQVSLRLQTVLDRTVNVTVHSLSSVPMHDLLPSIPDIELPEKKAFILDLQNKVNEAFAEDESGETTYLINQDISVSLIPPSQPVIRSPPTDNSIQSLHSVSLIPTSCDAKLPQQTFYQVNSIMEPKKENTGAVSLSEQINTGTVSLAEQVNTGEGSLAEQNNIGAVSLAGQNNTGTVLLDEQINIGSVSLAEQVNTGAVTLVEQVNTGSGTIAEQVITKTPRIDDVLDHTYHEFIINNKQESKKLNHEPATEPVLHFITEQDVHNSGDSFLSGKPKGLETNQFVIETETSFGDELTGIHAEEGHVDVTRGDDLQIMELASTNVGQIVFDHSIDDNDSDDTTITQIIMEEENEESEMVCEFKCFQCSLLFASFEELATHSKVHNKPFVCDSCHQGFTTKGSLTVHQRRHTGDKPYKCDSCDQTFSTPGNLKRHCRTHTGEKPFTCAECHGKFTSNKNLKSHMLIHSGEKPFSCTICNARFTQPSTLRSHKKIHAEEKTFSCDICNKTFVQKSNMTSHRMRHSIERNFGCDFCQNRFHTKADLLRHACSHLAGAAGSHVNLFPCGMCNKSFSLNYLLNNHIHKEHKKYKSWQCILCKDKFFSRSNVVEHLLASRLKSGHQEALTAKDINNFSIQNQFILNLKAKSTQMELTTDIPPD